MNRRVRRIGRLDRNWPLASNYTLLSRSERDLVGGGEPLLEPEVGEVLPPVVGGVGPGRIYWLAVNAPAAGADFVYQNLESFPVLIYQVWLKLVTSAAAGNRIVAVALKDGGGAYAWIQNTNVAHAGSISRYYNFTQDFPVAPVAGSISGTLGVVWSWLPALALMPGWTFESILSVMTFPLDVADQISEIRFMVQSLGAPA